jgi:hypothetical protein
MSTLAATHRRMTAGLTGCVGACVAVIGFSQTDTMAAVPAAAGLSALAASDLTTHRFSLRTLRLATALVAVGFIADAERGAAWGRLAGALLIAGAVALGVAVLRVVTVGISFGDVLLLTFTVLIPAWLSPRSVVITILAAIVIGGAVAVAQRAGRSKKPSSPVGVALGPALLAGWAIGVVVG